MRDLVRNGLWILLAAMAIVLAAAACERDGEKDAEKPEAAQTRKTGSDEVSDALIANINEPWRGDFSGMAERRSVRVLVPYSKTFFFLDKGHKKGINLEFLTRFEKYLNKPPAAKKRAATKARSGIKVVIIPTRRNELLQRLVDGRGDLVVGNLTITGRRQALVDFSDPWLGDVKEYLVTPGSVPNLESIDEFSGKEVHVRASSSYHDSLEALNKRLRKAGKTPVRIVKVNEVLEDEDLLEMVNAGAIPAIIVDSHKAGFWAQVFGNIKVHEKVAVRSGGEIAWAFRKDSPELAQQVNAFIRTIKVGTAIGSSIFAEYLKRQKWLERLNNEQDRKKFTELTELFQKYGRLYDINWLILAAKAYQESRFDHGVKGAGEPVGIMQIKPATARSEAVNISDVTGLEDNIHAGTKYIRFLMDRYYADLSGDRFNQTLIAFAGYNAGPERIARLRKTAKERGLDDTKWFNNLEWVVSESVGPITVNYVRNIFQYFIIYQNIHQRRLELEKLKQK